MTNCDETIWTGPGTAGPGTASALPVSPDAMSCSWLEDVLGAAPGSLAGFEASSVGTGQMCDSFRLKLDWKVPSNQPSNQPDNEPSSEPSTLPRGDIPRDTLLRTLIAKCPSRDEASRTIARKLSSYRREVNWYRKLARDIPVNTPLCHFAAIADNDMDFLLLLEDLAPAQQGDQLAGLAPSVLGACIDEAAKLHAALWESPRLDALPWLARDNRDLVRSLFPTLYAGFRDRYARRLAPEILALGESLTVRLDAYLDRSASARTLTHGDLRLDNVLHTPDYTGWWVVDWQTLGIGSAAAELAYLVGTSIAAPKARRDFDKSAFAHWTSALRRRGVVLDEAALWQDYRVGALSGYVMAVFASMSVERTARGDEMFAVMAERPAQQAMDLGSLSLL